MATSLVLEWADGSYDFRLTWLGSSEVETKADAPIQVVYERVLIGSASLNDVTEIIRQGLIGGTGGVVDEKPVDTKNLAVVNRLIERYVTGLEAPPFLDSWTLSKAIISTFMVGYPPAQKKSAERQSYAETDPS